MNNISHPHTPRELIIRAEIPELGIRKAIRVMNTDTARQVLDQLSGKANLSADFVSQCRLYKTVGAASTGAASGNSTEKQHLAVDRHFGVANESAAYECEALPWDYADWQDHSDILIKRWQPHSSKSAPASRSNSLRQQANGACNSALPPSTALLHTITPTQNTGGRSHALEDSVVTLLSDTKKITMKGIGRIAQSLNPHSHASSQKKAVELKPTPVCPMPSFVFGVELDRVPADPNTGLPYVVEKLLAFIEQTDLKTEGIFRLSGVTSTVTLLKEEFDRSPTGGQEIDVNSVPAVDCHTAASLLKAFLRELPEPLLTFDLYNAWVSTQQPDHTPTVKMEYLQTLVRALPTRNYTLLSRLCLFFSRLCEYTQWNKMSLQNIATVLGPNILRSRNESASTMVFNANAVNAVALELVKNAKAIFKHPQQWSVIQPSGDSMPQGQCCAIALALYSYKAQYSGGSGSDEMMFGELSFHANDIILIWAYSTTLQKQKRTAVSPSDSPCSDLSENTAASQPGWWIGEVLGTKGQQQRKLGIVPSNYIQIMWRRCVVPALNSAAASDEYSADSPIATVASNSDTFTSHKATLLQSDSASVTTAESVTEQDLSILESAAAACASSRLQVAHKDTQTDEDAVEASLLARISELERKLAEIKQQRSSAHVSCQTAATDPIKPSPPALRNSIDNFPRPPPPLLRVNTENLRPVQSQQQQSSTSSSATSIPASTPVVVSLTSRPSVHRRGPPPPPPAERTSVYVEELLAKLDSKRDPFLITPPPPLDSVEVPQQHNSLKRQPSVVTRTVRAPSANRNHRHSLAGPLLSALNSDDRPRLHFPAPPSTPPLTTYL